MKLFLKLLILVFGLILVACSGTMATAVPDLPEAPALLMFYTEG